MNNYMLYTNKFEKLYKVDNSFKKLSNSKINTNFTNTSLEFNPSFSFSFLIKMYIYSVLSHELPH